MFFITLDNNINAKVSESVSMFFPTHLRNGLTNLESDESPIIVFNIMNYWWKMKQPFSRSFNLHQF